MSGTSLTDRYVWTVTRQLPPETGPDIARELRGTIEETVEGRIEAGEDPAVAERETIVGLGDPDVLAREYGGRPNHLIGPAFFPAWVRLVRLLLTILVPLAVIGTVIAHALGTDAGFGAIVGEGLCSPSRWRCTWSSGPRSVFAVAERYGSPGEQQGLVGTWDPDELADPADRARRAGMAEMLLEVVSTLVVIGLCVWQWGGVGEHAVQVLDPALGMGWQGLIIGFLAVDVLVTVAAWARGGWSAPLAAVSLVSAVVSGVALVWLLLTDRLLTDLPAQFHETFGWSEDWSVLLPAVAVGIVVICGWEAVTALRRMRDSDPA
ncbi:permease prefix domain 1-containing protein [Janibacter hoylei]|uniref:permease prefix domain 1-containing protein n=1 Tax=Janibacter hoylei TaxID=364298 RepID=UPI0022389249|nr:permease prefix domain 1-containing protein [Janibacter hoylei]MCW4601371.1 permease prefix domain 1-containing protein [Janibacter hoylei]